MTNPVAKEASRLRIAVVGAGVAGLSAAREALRRRPDAELVVYEAASRVGGLVATDRPRAGLLVERGPDSVATQKPAALEMARELGLGDELVSDGVAPRRAFVVHEGKLVPMPRSLFGASGSSHEILLSPLLTAKGKLRLALEPFVPRRASEGSETVADFVGRRFGSELVERALDPVLRGIYGAPASELGAAEILPHLVAFERRHGSVARGMTRTSPPAPKGSAPLPPAVSFKGGMEALPTRLAAELGERVRTKTRIARLGRRDGAFVVEAEAGEVSTFDRVVLAVPVTEASRLLLELAPEAARELCAVRTADVETVTFVFARDAIPRPLSGTGFVVARGERRVLTAMTWSSRKWHGRAPLDVELLRCFFEAHGMDDATALAAVRADLADLLDIQADPLETYLDRRTAVLPVYEVGHLARIARVRALLSGLPGLALAGNAFDGLGIPDCLASGRKAAEHVLTESVLPLSA